MARSTGSKYIQYGFNSPEVIKGEHAAEAFLEAKAPAALSTVTSKKVSKGYKKFGTWDAIQPLIKKGYGIVAAHQKPRMQKNTEEFNIETSKHTVVLTPPNVTSLTRGLRTVLARVTNSHDAASAFKVEPYVAVIACLNGLLVPKYVQESVSYHHLRNHPGEVYEGVYRVVNDTEMTEKLIDTMHSVRLSQRGANAFTYRAFDKLSLTTRRVDPLELLTNRFAGQEELTLHNVLQRVQYNALRGNLSILDDYDQPIRGRTINQIAAVERADKIDHLLLQTGILMMGEMIPPEQSGIPISIYEGAGYSKEIFGNSSEAQYYLQGK